MFPPGQNPVRIFQRLTMEQNRAAVLSVSYMAECASDSFQSSPAAWTERESTVCPKARPASVAVSNELNGCKGLRLKSVRAMAAFRNDKSKNELCPTRIARWQPVARTSFRTGWKICLRASCSGTAFRKGLSTWMPVISSDLGLILAPSKGSTFTETVSAMNKRPKSSIRMMQAAISSSASFIASNPPVSTSITTGRNPLKRSAMRGIIGPIRQALEHKGLHRKLP